MIIKMFAIIFKMRGTINVTCQTFVCSQISIANIAETSWFVELNIQTIFAVNMCSPVVCWNIN